MSSRGHIGILAAAFVAPALADVTLIGSATIPWDATDRSGLTGMIGDSKIPRSRLASSGSGLAYTGAGNLFLGVCDRGPVDVAVEYDTRFQAFSIEVTSPAVASPGGGNGLAEIRISTCRTPSRSQAISRRRRRRFRWKERWGRENAKWMTSLGSCRGSPAFCRPSDAVQPLDQLPDSRP
jgi:hypothetical protein